MLKTKKKYIYTADHAIQKLLVTMENDTNRNLIFMSLHLFMTFITKIEFCLYYSVKAEKEVHM